MRRNGKRGTAPLRTIPLSYTLKYKRILFYLLISETALVALVLTTEASDITTKLKIIIIKPFLIFKIVILNVTFVS